MPVLLVLCACPDAENAETLAASLVDESLAACVNVLPEMRSIYRWEGRVERANECMLLIKTTGDRFGALKDHIVKTHPYSLPEVLAFEATTGLDRYLGWIQAETGPAGEST